MRRTNAQNKSENNQRSHWRDVAFLFASTGGSLIMPSTQTFTGFAFGHFVSTLYSHHSKWQLVLGMGLCGCQLHAAQWVQVEDQTEQPRGQVLAVSVDVLRFALMV